jgi:hypothetical protein
MRELPFQVVEQTDELAAAVAVLATPDHLPIEKCGRPQI